MSRNFIKPSRRLSSRARLDLLYFILALITPLIIVVFWVVDVLNVIYLLSSLVLLSGVVSFLWHGWYFISAAGMYYFGTAVFGGLAGLSIARSEGYTIDGYLVLALLVILCSNQALYWFYLRKSNVFFDRIDVNEKPLSGNANGARRGVILGLTMFALGVVIESARLPLGPIGGMLGYSGTSLAIVSALAGFHSNLIIRHPFRVLLSGGLFIVFTSVFFENSGRLNLVSLVMAISIAVLAYLRLRYLKRVIVVMMIPALLFAGILRVHRHSEITASTLNAESVAESGEGLASMRSPLHYFAEVMRVDGDGKTHTLGDLDYPGQTFVEAMLVPIPRQIWPDKPVGLGMRLTLWIRPSLAKSGHSYAALSFSEWYMNFGWLGFAFMLLIVGFFLQWADRKLSLSYASPPFEFESIIKFTALVIAVGGVLDYIWVGLFTFNARAGLRIVALLGVLYLFKFGLSPFKQSISR